MSVAGDRAERSVFKELHEDLEQSFCAEIAIVEKHLKIVKETEGNKSIMQTAERVEMSESEESQGGKVEKWMNVNSIS